MAHTPAAVIGAVGVSLDQSGDGADARGGRGGVANRMVWCSDVRTFTRRDAGATAVMSARAVPSASWPLMSAADWEGTRTVTVFPFQSRVWYVVLAPSTDTIVALGALACG